MERRALDLIKCCVKKHRDVPAVFVNDKPFFTLMYNTYAPAMRYLADFKDCGIHFYQLCCFMGDAGLETPTNIWIGENKYNFKELDKYIRIIISIDPEAYIMLRINLSPPEWWQKSHPDELQRSSDGDLCLESIASEVWRRDTGKALKAFISHINNFYSRHVIGYIVAAMHTEEWFYRESFFTFSDYSKPMIKAFGRDLPTKEQRLAKDFFMFRDPEISQSLIDFYRFHNEIVAEAVIYFAKIVKKETKNRLMCGAFYGYIIGLHNMAYLPQNTGHLALRKILDSPYVDFLCGPSVYDNRRIGGTTMFTSATDSIKLSGKLWFNEADTATFIAPQYFNLNKPQDILTLQDSLNIIKRDFCKSLINGADMWLFDMSGGWFAHPELLKLISKIRGIADFSINVDRSSAAEIAVIVDEESFYYQSLDNGVTYPGILRQMTCEIDKIGAPYDIFLLSDIKKKDLCRYKAYFFLNAYRLTKEYKEIINYLKRDNRLMIWVYAPGFIDDKLSIDYINEVTGINMKYEKDEAVITLKITNTEHPITKGIAKYLELTEHCGSGFSECGTINRVGPVFYCDDKDAVVLGKLTCNNKPGLVLKEFRNYKSIYTAAPLIPASLLRNIVRYGGVHIYGDYNDTMYVDKSFIAIHSKYTGSRKIKMTNKSDVYELFSGRLVRRNCSEFTDYIPANTTHLYYVGKERLYLESVS